ncbi:hypothetical protein [Stenotrophomonas maltophilia]|uniref:hypothetical protein n=1 Tax=Stenotrophomonas maltophilia TaxID=40324 RepID=UPI000F67781A|nr:hypothetical protein [Stenotrophomonas maltophilia]RRU72231.1 hypothetical protein EGJ89_10510 [Stenotrophomonas maltophilia]
MSSRPTAHPRLFAAALMVWAATPSPLLAQAVVEADRDLASYTQFDDATAIATTVRRPTGQEAKVPTWVVDTLLSEPGQTKDEFIRRVASYLDRLTAHTGAEACGELSTSPKGDQWGVRIVTQNSQLHCLIVKPNAPFDFIATGEIIHSHPREGLLTLSAHTARLMSVLDPKSKRYSAGQSRHVSPEKFSDADYSAGRGYLVANGRLLYQAGVGTERDLGSIRPQYAGP